MFLKKKAVFLASMLVLNSWVGAVLADEERTSLTVKANLIPTSCEVNLDNGKDSVMDFGNVRDVKSLKARIIKLKVTCKNKTLATISIHDDKIGSEILDNSHFVVVNDQGEKKGYFSLKIGEVSSSSEEDTINFLVLSDNGEEESWKEGFLGS